MSSFNETIKFSNSFQSGNGTTLTTPQQLDNVKSAKAHKGVLVKNTDSSQDMWVGKSNINSTTIGFQLKAGDEIFLEIDDPADIYQMCNLGGTTYSWCAH